jgi:protein TonB
MEKRDSSRNYLLVAGLLLLIAIVLLMNPFKSANSNNPVLLEEISEENNTENQMNPALEARSTGKTRKDEPVDESEAIFDIVEVEPEFIGGEIAMQNFIKSRVKYPELSIQMGDQGKVYVKFVVEKSGFINHISIARGVTEELNQEAMRVIKTMPRWNPGRQRGEPVRTRVVVPIVFRLG